MRPFVVYDTTTGKILRTGHCQNDMLELQAGLGEAVLEARASDREHEVDISTHEIKEMSAPLQTRSVVLPPARPTNDEIDLISTIDDVRGVLKKIVAAR